ncbi:hypothetical protein E2C01_007404 [Portunus trituberculatus]|uniref:Uncharacterized protein n=1 Tax=Portunus trituberculatus TaxID=210409 RepID=A0A5B7D130_PORTR|nr:hypothetical protein [Portunus trituberculatus]
MHGQQLLVRSLSCIMHRSGRRHCQDYQALECGGAARLYHYPMTWIATTLFLCLRPDSFERETSTTTITNGTLFTTVTTTAAPGTRGTTVTCQVLHKPTAARHLRHRSVSSVYAEK